MIHEQKKALPDIPLYIPICESYAVKTVSVADQRGIEFGEGGRQQWCTAIRVIVGRWETGGGYIYRNQAKYLHEKKNLLVFRTFVQKYHHTGLVFQYFDLGKKCTYVRKSFQYVFVEQPPARTDSVFCFFSSVGQSAKSKRLAK